MTEPGHSHTPSVRQEKLPPRDTVDEVAPGVLRMQLTIAFPGLGHVNCYAIEDDRGIALVDPGLPGLGPWKELTSRMERAGLPLRRVHTVPITHSHPDHFGAAERISQVTGADIVTEISGITSNPMNQAAASKVALVGVADFTWNAPAYDPGRAHRQQCHAD